MEKWGARESAALVWKSRKTGKKTKKKKKKKKPRPTKIAHQREKVERGKGGAEGACPRGEEKKGHGLEIVNCVMLTSKKKERKK